MLPLCKHGSSSRPLPQWLQPCQASKAKTTSIGTTMPSCHQLLCRISSYELWILDPCSCNPLKQGLQGWSRATPPLLPPRQRQFAVPGLRCLLLCQSRVVPGLPLPTRVCAKTESCRVGQNLQARKGPLELCSFGESVVDIDFLVSESHCYESVIFEVFRILYLSKTLVPCCWLMAQVGGK